MSLNVFLGFCILGINFMFYAFFQWTNDDKRSALTGQLAAGTITPIKNKTTHLTATQEDSPITQNEL